MIAKLSASSVSQEKLTEPSPRGPIERPVLPSLRVRSIVNGCSILGECADGARLFEERSRRTRTLHPAKTGPYRKAQAIEQRGPFAIFDLWQKSEHEILLLAHEGPAMVAEQRVSRAIGLVGSRSVPDPAVKAQDAARLALGSNRVFRLWNIREIVRHERRGTRGCIPIEVASRHEAGAAVRSGEVVEH